MTEPVEPPPDADHALVTVLRPLPGLLPELDALYRDLHRNPELSGQERRTSGLAADWLRAAGYDVAAGVGGHGVVGVLRNGPGPTVLLRGDMDALPVLERTGLPYASEATGTMPDGRVTPVMHACGHDAHTVSLLGAARLLAASMSSWRGTLLAVAQPAEETLSGAAGMLRDGLYERFGRPDVALGQHVVPLPAGVIAHRVGALMAAASSLEITIHGRGGHGSRPETTVDPIVVAAHTITRLQTIVAREVSPNEPAVVTVGRVRAGEAANIIPDQASLSVSVRAFDDGTHERLVAAVRRIALAEAAAGDCPREPEIVVTAATAVTANDPAATERVRAAHVAHFGADRVIQTPAVMGSEDFALFGPAGVELYGAPATPSVFWLVGMVERQEWEATPGQTPEEKVARLPSNHSPYFAPDRGPTLTAATEAMAVAAMSFLRSDAVSGQVGGGAAGVGVEGLGRG